MKKQTVLIVHNYYQVPGGEDAVVENEKNLLLENGHKVLIYKRHNDEIKNKGILKKLLLPLETIFSFKTYREVKKIIKKENVDIVHVHNTLPLISPSVYYSARHCKVSVIQTIHNFRLLCPAATFTKNNEICEECLEKSLICAIRNKCYRNSIVQSSISAINLSFHRFIGTYRKVDGYIALTEFNKNKLKTLIDSKKIFIKPNFTNFGDDSLIDIENRTYFLYIGRIDKLKGVDLILKAWKSIEKEQLYIVGRGPFREEAEKYIAENNIENVKLLGFKNRDEVEKLMSNSKALIMASQCYEGFPMTIVESFSLGVPVISGKIGNMAGIIEHEKNGLLYKYDSYEELTKQVERLNNNDLLNKLSIGARETFCSRYNKKINYDILMKIYNTVGGFNESM
ncbi:glycosyltransferase family 4 protein [Clostridium sp. HBUAS56017]|uniref:glycosyltransferase family 4 protein n=1 Tax=Clostridium sp. HBUAS56017 TaxID=2571128 RepID=UPI00117804D7|nr:glycosyltransferase family 4 protein [Clostridium sp. HBUAS56017]